MRNEQSYNSYSRSAGDTRSKDVFLELIAAEIQSRGLRHADLQVLDAKLTKNHFTDLKEAFGGNISLERIRDIATGLGLHTGTYDPSRVAA